MDDGSILIGYDIRPKLRREIAYTNLGRWRQFAVAIIAIELVLICLLLHYYSLNALFKSNVYLTMYALMVFVTGVFWWIFKVLRHKLDQNIDVIKQTETAMLLFVAFLMLWGAVVAWLDQTLYGNITVFLVNMLVGSIMFYLRSKLIAIPQITAAVLFAIGLPFFQPSLNMLIGHYVNIAIFIVLVWVVARTNYQAMVKNLESQMKIKDHDSMLIAVNDHLVSEIQAHEKDKQELEAANERLRIISSLDALTGIPNRRRMDESIEEIWQNAQESKSRVSVFMIDIDLFKLYNDTYGHLAGDICLRDVARVLSECSIGHDDMLARYGGEEFLYVVAGLDQDEAYNIGERIRAGIEALGIEHNDSTIGPVVTASVGISSCIPDQDSDPTASVARADQAMYQAKSAGRNKVIMAE